MSKLAKALTAAAGNAGSDPLYAEDVFSTYLYEGTGATQSINNGIDLDGEGGMTWIKCRNTAFNNVIFDTERGAPNALLTNTTDQNISFYSDSLTSFNSDGFSLGADTTSLLVNNGSNRDYCSWTFRKAEKFFDVVTYTGDGNATHEIAHNLGSVPGCIIIKNTSNATNWLVYHKDTVNDLMLNTTSGGLLQIINSVTSTSFNFSYSSLVNALGDTYVAYVFASDAGGFGDDGDESVIKCGSYTGNGTYLDGPEIDLGFEPQWLLIKSTGTESWRIADNMRGIEMGTAGAYLSANLTQIEVTSFGVELQATGFKVMSNNADLNSSGQDYIYIAIRRPMKTPESGTEVFAIDTLGGTAPNPPGFNGLLVDWAWKRVRNTTDDWYSQSRLTGPKELKLNANDDEGTDTSIKFDYQDGWLDSNGTLSTQLSWMFKRATGFFDVVCDTGTGTTHSFNHNLGVKPELIIRKVRSTTQNWCVFYDTTATTLKRALLNSTGPSNTNRLYSEDYGLSAEPTSETIYISPFNADLFNGTGQTYVNYLFATLAGVSKVGSYTGTGNSLDIDCGFANGARFVMIKRTDSTSDWWVWDTARGIVAGNDPTLQLNSTAAETTTADYIDPLSSGFTLTTEGNWLYGMNYPTGNYIFLAIA